MARRRRSRKAANPRRRRHARRNPAKVIVIGGPRHHRRRHSRRRKASNPRRHRRYGRRRNPMLFGAHSSTTQTLQAVGGGLVGVAIAKAIPPMLPAMLTSSPVLRVVSTLASAYLAKFVFDKFAPGKFADAVFFGGLMQTGSIALNTFLPGVGGRFGLGELIAGNFPVPQNPIRAGAAMSVVPAKGNLTNGIGRAYGSAY